MGSMMNKSQLGRSRVSEYQQSKTMTNHIIETAESMTGGADARMTNSTIERLPATEPDNQLGTGDAQQAADDVSGKSLSRMSKSYRSRKSSMIINN